MKENKGRQVFEKQCDICGTKYLISSQASLEGLESQGWRWKWSWWRISFIWLCPFCAEGQE